MQYGLCIFEFYDLWCMRLEIGDTHMIGKLNNSCGKMWQTGVGSKTSLHQWMKRKRFWLFETFIEFIESKVCV